MPRQLQAVGTAIVSAHDWPQPASLGLNAPLIAMRKQSCHFLVT